MESPGEANLIEGEVLEVEGRKQLVGLREMVWESATQAGENFAGNVRRLTAVGLLQDGKKTAVSFVVKKMPEDPAQISFLQSLELFQVEVLVYREILPMVEEVLKKQNIPPLWPSYFGEICEFLIFSDLNIKNYKSVDRVERLDMVHACLAARTLGIFHGASKVFLQRGCPGPVLKLPPFFHFRDMREVKRFLCGGIKAAGNAILQQWGPDWKDIGERLLKKSMTINKDLIQLWKTEDSRHRVICHGDPWLTNIFFKYSKAVDRPIGVRFIDFQMCHYGSYIYDLIFFTSSCLPPYLRRYKLDEVMTAYRRGLAVCLEFHGLQRLLPTLEEIKGELRRHALFSLVMLLCETPIHTATVENALIFENIISNEEGSIGQNPEIYKGKFKQEVDEELLRWAEEALF